MDLVAVAVECLVALVTLCGLGYMALALWSARDFEKTAARGGEAFTPDVSVLKPVKGLDPRMHAGFVSHCRQQYGGRFEIVFGVGSLDDPAVEEVHLLQRTFPECAIRLVECPERLGTNGKVSSLVQMLPAASYEHVVINDSDILVGPKYLERVMRPLRDVAVGLVTAPYLGRTDRQRPTLWARLEALGISTEFFPGVLTARKIEGGKKFALGSTLATTKAAIARVGGLEELTEFLADDYELGARMVRAGLGVELVPEIVETAVPQYGLHGFLEHQLRWMRSMRDSRKAGYLGFGVTYALPWALLTCVASGLALWSFTLLSVVVLARVAVALSVGVGVLRDEQVLRDLWLLPLRDCVSLALWAWSFSGETVVWRGETFRLEKGRLTRV